MHAEANVSELSETAVYIVETIAALPPLPAAAQEIIAQFADEFIDADQVAAVVEHDPGICAKLLGLANSAYFNLAEPVTDMREAVSRVLGVDTVRSLVFAMAMQQSFDSGKCPAFDAERFWLDAIAVAEFCKKLARMNRDMAEIDMNLAYPAGLCHNLGLMALAHIKPGRTDKVLREHAEEPGARSLSDRFMDEFETDHRCTTAELARAWSLPEILVHVYSQRVAGSERQPEHQLVCIVDACTAAIGNQRLAAEARTDLGEHAGQLGFGVEEFENLADPGDRQRERMRSIASTMQGY